MSTFRVRGTAALALLVALGGCATHGPVPPGVGGDVATPGPATGRALAERLGTAPVGTSIALEPGGPLRARSASVLETYTAASGHRCRRVLLDDRADPSRIVCLSEAEGWYLPRELRTRQGPSMALTGPLLGAARGAARPAPAPFSSRIVAGETLWDFALRTTGSGRHWPAIAERNGIVDDRSVPAGAELAVPAELVLREL